MVIKGNLRSRTELIFREEYDSMDVRNKPDQEEIPSKSKLMNTWDTDVNLTKRRRARNSSDLPLAESQQPGRAGAKGYPSRSDKISVVERTTTYKNGYHLFPEKSAQTCHAHTLTAEAKQADEHDEK